MIFKNDVDTINSKIITSLNVMTKLGTSKQKMLHDQNFEY